MENIMNSPVMPKKYIKNYFLVIINLILIIISIIAFNAAFSNVNLLNDSDQDEKTVNPNFTLQHYVYFNDIDLSEKNCNDSGTALKVIDTSNGGNGKSSGNLPTNGHENAAKCILLEEVNSNSRALVTDKKYTIKTAKKLVPLFEEEETDYQTNPRMKYMDRLYNNMDDYNKNYTLTEVWVLKDEKDNKTDKTSTTESDWTIYKVPSIEGGKHNPDAIIFTNNPNNNNITKPNENGSVSISNEGYTILIKENSVIRLVYEPMETTGYKKSGVNFFDYNISDGHIYTTNNTDNPQNTSNQTDTATWYAYTKEAGINSASNYSGDGAKYAFGNTNAGSNLGNEKTGDYYINRFNSANTSGSSYGLVKNNELSADKTPVWNTGISGPDLFSSKDVTGKVSYTNDEFSMLFDRIGGTFILSDVVKNSSDSQGNKSLTDLDYFKITYHTSSKTIYSNEFWPMDLADSWGTDGNDMKFGSKTYQNNRRYFGATNSSRSVLPITDCEEDHNPYFGVSFQAEFTVDPGYNAPLDFFFFGDDDFWLFLEKPDGSVVQIADIGGVHSALGQYINLWDYVEKVPYENENGKPNKESGKYKLYFFYTERGASGSTLYMRFTIPLDSVRSQEQETSSLIIGKEVRGLEINNNAKYDFEITFTENGKDNEDLYLYEVYNRTAEGEENPNSKPITSGVFKTENHKFSLSNNQYLVISGLPDTLKFKVKETTKELNDETKPTENRKISVKTTHKEGFTDHASEEKVGNEVECSVAEVEYVQFFNSYTGIIVTKEAFGETLKDKYFDFTVTLSDTSINDTYGDMKFTNGVATFKLKSGESKQATNLPDEITYTVEENVDESEQDKLKVKKVNETGKTEYGQIDDVYIYNYYENNLKLEKKVIGKETKDYKFKIDLKIDERISKEEYSYKKYKNNQVIATSTISNTGGEITLKDGEYLIIEGLPTSAIYTIEELDSETSKTTYCKSTDPENCTEEFDGKKVIEEKLDTTNYIRFTNSYSGLTITKTVIGSNAKDQEFKFKITLDNEEITGQYGDFNFENGVAEFTLKNGDTKKTSSLPQNTQYTVTEEQAEGYKTIKVGDTGNTTYDDINAVEFYNYKINKLKIEKEVIGLPESITKDYQFTLSFKNLDEKLKTEQASYTKYTVKDNTAIASGTGQFNLGTEMTFNLKAGEYIVIDDLPNDAQYELTENDSSASKVSYIKGKIEADKKSLEKNSTTGKTISSTLNENNYFKFINSYAGLTIHKTIIGTKGDKDKDFIFTITLSDKDITGTYGDISFKNGIATFTLKHDQSKTAYGLPENITYKIIEKAEDDYSVTSENAEGKIEAEKIVTANFYNYLTNRLKIEKEIVGTVAVSANSYKFKFELSDIETGYPEEYQYTKYDQDNNVLVSNQTIKSGEEFTIKGHEYVIIEGLPDNAVVKVTEEVDKVTQVTNYKGTIKKGLSELANDGQETNTNINENNYLKFVNTYSSISVKKIILGKPEDMKKKFKFTVTLTNKEEITGKYGDLEFTNGVATFELSNEEIVIASGLPEDTTYTVTEDTQGEFQTIKNNDTGTLTLGETNEVVFINYITSDIRIEKATEGKEATKDKEYTFQINFTSDVENADIKKTYEYTKYGKDGQEINPSTETPEETSSSNTISDGETLTLKSGEYIVLHDIEPQAQVKIKETNLDATKVNITTSGISKEYKTETESGEITVNVPYVNYIKFTNIYGGIDITKEVYNVRDDDREKEFTFTITLGDKNVNGQYGDLKFINGVATFTLKHGETKYTSSLPEDTTYEIVEQSIEGYKNHSENNKGTIITGEQQEVKFTNLRVLDLRVTKEIKGLALSNTKYYDFYLRLNEIENEMYAKEYQYKKYNQYEEELTEGTFVIGDNSFKLQNGEYIIIKDLPEILNYELKEDTNSNSSTDYIIGTTFAGLTENISLGNEYKNDVSSINNIKFINKYASIKITKTVTGPAADYNREYQFTITLDNPNINGLYGDLTFKDGVATFTLKNQESKSATALPENISYEVTEEPLEGYEVTYTGAKGVTKYGTINEVEFINKRTLIDYILPPNTGAREIFDKYYILFIINIVVLTIGLIAHVIRKNILKTKKL